MASRAPFLVLLLLACGASPPPSLAHQTPPATPAAEVEPEASPSDEPNDEPNDVQAPALEPAHEVAAAPEAEPAEDDVRAAGPERRTEREGVLRQVLEDGATGVAVDISGGQETFDPGGNSANNERVVPSRVQAQSVLSGSSFDRTIVERMVRRRIAMVRRCHERELRVDPRLEGRIVVRWILEPTGRVASADVTENTIGHAGLAECVRNHLRRFRFNPGPDAVTTVTTTYVLTIPR